MVFYQSCYFIRQKKTWINKIRKRPKISVFFIEKNHKYFILSIENSKKHLKNSKKSLKKAQKWAIFASKMCILIGI